MTPQSLIIVFGIMGAFYVIWGRQGGL